MPPAELQTANSRRYVRPGERQRLGIRCYFLCCEACTGGIVAVEVGHPRAVTALAAAWRPAPACRPHAVSAAVSTVTGVTDRNRHRQLYRFELEPEVRDWLDSLSDSDFKRVDEVAGMLAEKGPGLGGPWSDHLEGAVWELRLRLHQMAVRVTYWCRPDGAIVLLTVFRKTRQHDQRQIDRAVRAQQVCERDHRAPVAQTYERQV